MKYYSTNNKNEKVSFRKAILQGLASDKGLFMPEVIPRFKTSFIENLSTMDLQEIAFNIAQKFVEDEISKTDLHKIITASISFPAPVYKLSQHTSVLELFHGPTLAFKDFGARFMSRTMEHLLKSETKEITILVATSGDTGSAVASGFLNVEGIKVIVLYPEGKVSKIQEKQMTTLGNNITAIEIDGTFDDCQMLVKTSFVDSDLNGRINLSSANSINIGRLIPQSFYYFESFKNVYQKGKKIVYSVPSGNLGNLTAGLISKKMGLPINKFIAATNSNNVFSEYINEGKFNPRKSKITLSNAMDVGNPSNFDRIIDIFNNDHSSIKNEIYSTSFSDEETIKKIKEVFEKYEYIIDPHGAVGYLALDQYLNENDDEVKGIVLETAHPAKFMDVYSNLDFRPDIPKRLNSCINKNGSSIKLSKNYDEFKEFLID